MAVCTSKNSRDDNLQFDIPESVLNQSQTMLSSLLSLFVCFVALLSLLHSTILLYDHQISLV